MTVLLMLYVPVVLLSAQPGVTITGLAVEAGTVTLDVRWEPLAPPTVWSDTVWVFVDYNNAGVMRRLPLTGASLTASSWPEASATVPLPNNLGAWVVGNARTNTSFSATVQLLTAITNVAGACVYASNYPPVGEYITASSITFTGTPSFDLELNTGAISVQKGYVLLENQTLLSFTDKTGAPGIIKCIPMMGGLDFSVPATVPKGQPASFVVSAQPTTPAPSAITYTWSAPEFSPETYTGAPFNTTAPATANTYPVTLTARSEGYCDKSVTNNVTVIDRASPTAYPLRASATGFCADDATVGVTFALDGTQAGVKYRLHRGDEEVGELLTGDGSAQTFTGGPFVTAGVYTAWSVAEGQYSAESMTGSHAISEIPLPAKPAAPTSNGPQCEGTAITFSANTVPGATGLDWKGSAGISGTGTSKTTTASAANSYTAQVRAYITSGGTTCYSAYSDITSVTVTAVPDISKQPVSPTDACSENVTMTVTASSVTTAYQWRKNGINITDEGTGYTTATYTTTVALSANATYSVVVANGSCSVTSSNALIAAQSCCAGGYTAPGSTVNFEDFNPCPGAGTGWTWTLTDTRESNINQSYKVKKMADGRIWMVQDMKFGNLCGDTFAGSSGSDKTGKVSDIGSYYGDCRSNTYAGAGYLYDWAAAINKAGAYNGSSSNVGCSGTASGTSGTVPGACQGICPDGWHIPTGHTSGECNVLHTATGNCSTSNDDCWDAASAWEGVYGGACPSNGTPEGAGRFGAYWTSTYDTQSRALYHYLDAGTTSPGGNSNYKNSGRHVRCVRNY
jgi:uncharacterized protein (TIGR02145 family)